MIVVRALYGLRSSGAAFRALLAEVLDILGYVPSKADPDVYLGPAIKSDGFKYYEYILCYVDDVLWISDDPMTTMEGIQMQLKLKGDNIEPHDMYLGADLTKMHNESNLECWAIPSNQ